MGWRGWGFSLVPRKKRRNFWHPRRSLLIKWDIYWIEFCFVSSSCGPENYSNNVRCKQKQTECDEHARPRYAITLDQLHFALVQRTVRETRRKKNKQSRRHVMEVQTIQPLVLGPLIADRDRRIKRDSVFQPQIVVFTQNMFLLWI